MYTITEVITMNQAIYTGATFVVQTLQDVSLLRQINEANSMKPNFAKIARELNVDWRTVKKYYYHGSPSGRRHRASILDDYEELIHKLLLDETLPHQFYYKATLWRYLCDNYGLAVSESTFRHYISKKKEFQDYFTKRKGGKRNLATLHYETAPGEQAQIDWKENISFLDCHGVKRLVNVLVLTLSYSRVKLFFITEDRSRNTLLHGLTVLFERLGGVPKQIVTDNMKSVVDIPRRGSVPAKLNAEIVEFANTFGTTFTICRPRRPQTKGKVETSMKFLDEIHAYQGQLDWEGLLSQVQRIENRVNMNICQGTGCAPFHLWQKEKESLQRLPRAELRNSFKILHSTVKVNNTHMISYQGNAYSVPAGYAGKRVRITVENGTLYVYDTMNLIATHSITAKKKNYSLQDYASHIQAVHPYLTEEESILRARNELERIDTLYGTAYRLQQAKGKLTISKAKANESSSG